MRFHIVRGRRDGILTIVALNAFGFEVWIGELFTKMLSVSTPFTSAGRLRARHGKVIVRLGYHATLSLLTYSQP
jgi:hypothetical protein